MALRNYFPMGMISSFFFSGCLATAQPSAPEIDLPRGAPVKIIDHGYTQSRPSLDKLAVYIHNKQSGEIIDRFGYLSVSISVEKEDANPLLQALEYALFAPEDDWCNLGKDWIRIRDLPPYGSPDEAEYVSNNDFYLKEEGAIIRRELPLDPQIRRIYSLLTEAAYQRQVQHTSLHLPPEVVVRYKELVKEQKEKR